MSADRLARRARVDALVARKRTSRRERLAALTDAQVFGSYFAVADEIYEGLVCRPPLDQSRPMPDSFAPALTLADLTPEFVGEAREAADRLGLSWPPYLPEAEEWALAHREEYAR